MPADLRACVHEYGFAIVTACLKHKVSKPAAIRELVREIWTGARQPKQTGGAESTLDWLLIQNDAGISAKTLLRVLADASLVVVPANPNAAMIDASMQTVSGFNMKVTKREKHRLRLQAAINVLAKKQRGEQ
jgi:hypothetical protein